MLMGAEGKFLGSRAATNVGCRGNIQFFSGNIEGCLAWVCTSWMYLRAVPKLISEGGAQRFPIPYHTHPSTFEHFSLFITEAFKPHF